MGALEAGTSVGGRSRRARVRAASARVALAVARRLRDGWRQVRAWRRISFTRGGAAFTAGALGVGFAAMNTGNNLLFLLLGAMLGSIAISGWLSERAIRGLEVTRRVPRGATVGADLRIDYVARNHKRLLPSLAVEFAERGLAGRAFVARVPAGGEARARSLNRFVHRGVYPLGTLTLSTAFPFGLFLKERDIEVPGELVVWPRHDRAVRAPRPAGGRARRMGAASTGAPAPGRGEYRGLRLYRPGDDPRDIHWKTSARLSAPVVRDYERDGAEALWIVLDVVGQPGEEAEAIVEVAASLAARATREGKRFGVTAGGQRVGPGSGPAQLEAALDLLARVDFNPTARPPLAPAAPERCVLVGFTRRAGFGDAYGAA